MVYNIQMARLLDERNSRGRAALDRAYLNVCEVTTHAELDERRGLVYHVARVDPTAPPIMTLDEIDAPSDDVDAPHGDRIPTPLRTSTREVITT